LNIWISVQCQWTVVWEINICHMLSSGLFPGVCSLNSNVLEHCLFHLHRRVGMKCDCSWEWLKPTLFTYNTPHSQLQSHVIPTHLWRCNRQSVAKCWHLNYRCQGTTQKKTYDIVSYFVNLLIISVFVCIVLYFMQPIRDVLRSLIASSCAQL
jgi:hypothetical protein